MTQETDRNNPPAFNLEPVITVLIAAFVLVHLIKTLLVPQSQMLDFLLLFGAIPARYGDFASQIPYAFAAWYTPLTHMFVHGDWIHLAFNSLWMLAFGSPLAVRLGAGRFLLFTVAGVLAGFAFHLISHIDDFTPMIGASGAVSAYMAGAIRLERDISKPILPLLASFQNRGFLAFVIVWFGFNLLVGKYPELIGAEGTQIAWQAHVGGFLAGLLLVKVFDRKKTTTELS